MGEAGAGDAIYFQRFVLPALFSLSPPSLSLSLTRFFSPSVLPLKRIISNEIRKQERRRSEKRREEKNGVCNKCGKFCCQKRSESGARVASKAWGGGQRGAVVK